MNIFTASGQGSAVARSLSGYGSSGPPTTPSNGTSRALRHLSKRERARVLSLIATVRRLHACLGNLPDQFRVVLELATGVNAPRALSSAELAHYLHIRIGQVSRLEKRALRQLRRTAQAHTCSGAQQSTPGLLVFSGFGGVLGYGIAIGGVEAARYTKAPSSNPRGLRLKPAPPSVDTLLGIDAPPAVDEGWLIILLVLGGLLSIGFLFADKERRSRWLRRPPR